MRKFKSVDKIVSELRPVNSIYCIRKNSIKIACNWFNKNFPGEVLYAVKTNPHEEVVKEIKNSRINKFDTASIEEIKIVKKIVPDAECFYMNAIKSREHIKEAYFNYNIKSFALDTKDELLKIIEATENAQDLNLFVRISISNEHAEIDLSKSLEHLVLKFWAFLD